jgi:hypothetical protein
MTGEHNHHNHHHFHPLVITGMKNLGHTCALNAILQILAGIAELRAFFRTGAGHSWPGLAAASKVYGTSAQNERQRRIERALATAKRIGHRGRARSQEDSKGQALGEAAKSSVLEGVAEVIEALAEKSGGRQAVDPSMLYFAYLSLAGEGTAAFEMLDAHEIYHFLVGTMHGELVASMDEGGKETVASVDFKKNNRSAISHFFRGVRIAQLECGACGYRKASDEPFIDLSLSIATHLVPLERKRGARSYLLSSFCVEDCLAGFIDGEINGEIVCPGCHKRGAVKVSNCIGDLPEVVVINLNRAHFTLGRGSMKNDCFVDVNESIDFAPFCAPDQDKRDTKYALQGVVVHHGRGSDSGHYTSYAVRTSEDGHKVWLSCNDLDIHVLKTSIKETLGALPRITSQPSLLFYVRNCVKQPPTLQQLHDQLPASKPSSPKASIAPIFNVPDQSSFSPRPTSSSKRLKHIL